MKAQFNWRWFADTYQMPLEARRAAHIGPLFVYWPPIRVSTKLRRWLFAFDRWAFPQRPYEDCGLHIGPLSLYWRRRRKAVKP